MGNDNFYLGIFKHEVELVGVIDLGESQGTYKFFARENLNVKPIDRKRRDEFMKKYHPEKKID